MKISKDQATKLQNMFRGAMISNGDSWAHVSVLKGGDVIVITGDGDEFKKAIRITGEQ